MDVVLGMFIYFVFILEKIIEEYCQFFCEYFEYQVFDLVDLEKQLWEIFNYELVCVEFCGIGYWLMCCLVCIVLEEEYKDWLDQQQLYYMIVIYQIENDFWFIDGEFLFVVLGVCK